MTSAEIFQGSKVRSLAADIESWLREQLDNSNAQRFVVALSGGIDSALVCGLAARAVGADRVLAVLLPSSSDPDDEASARKVAQAFKVSTMQVDLTTTTESLKSVLPGSSEIASILNIQAHVGTTTVQLAEANIKPRLRMTALYYISNLCGGIVLGTGNKTEAMIGYFTKYGDGGVDLLPIVDLYKHEVRELARAIGVPESVIQRPPSAGLWQGQTDEGEIGLTYDELDHALLAISNSATEGIKPAVLEKVQHMISSSRHKRTSVPAFRRN